MSRDPAPSMAGIDPVGLQKLLTELGAVRDVLREAAGEIEQALTSVGLAAVDAQSVRRVAQWADGQVQQLRRRLDLARRLDSLEPWAPSGGVVWMNPSLLTAFPSAQAATDAANRLARHIKGHRGPLPTDVVDELGRYAADPGFAAVLLDALGAEEVASLPRRLAESERDARLAGVDRAELEALTQLNERAIEGFAAMLAATSLPTRPLTQEPERERHEKAAADLATRMLTQDAWGTAQILKRGDGSRFDSTFLAGFAGAMDAFDRRHGHGVWRAHAPGRGTGEDSRPAFVGTTGGGDPLDGMVDLMRLLGDNPTAGQRFLTAERIPHFATDRSWLHSDDGSALGGAFEAAATRVRGPGGKGTPDWESAAFTTRLIHTLGPHAEELPAGLRRPLAHVIGSYMPDVFDLAARPGSIEGLGVDRVDDPLTSNREVTGAQFTRADLRPLLEQISRNEEAFRYLTAAAAARGVESLDAAAERVRNLVANGQPTADSLEGIDQAIRPYAFSMGLLTSTAGAADISYARRNDANRRWVFALAATPTTILSPYQGFVANAALVGAGEPLLRAMDKTDEVRARHDDQTGPAVQELLDHQVTQAMQRHDLFTVASSDPDADPRRWTELYENPPDGPRDWNFLNADGSIKDLGQLSFDTGGSGQVYHKWLGGPAGVLLSDRQAEVDGGYRRGFPQTWGKG